MITITVDEVSLKNVQKRLGNMQSKAPLAISRALNKTAVSARVRIARRAQETYTVKTTNFKKEMSIQKANSGNLVAVIKSEGSPLPATSYKHSFPKSGGRLSILKSGGLKTILRNGNKAFKTKNKDYDGNLMLRTGKTHGPLIGVYGPSVPIMIGSEERVYRVEEPHIKEDLKKYVDAQIELLVR